MEQEFPFGTSRPEKRTSFSGCSAPLGNFPLEWHPIHHFLKKERGWVGRGSSMSRLLEPLCLTRCGSWSHTTNLNAFVLIPAVPEGALFTSQWRKRGNSSYESFSCWSWLNQKWKVVTQMTQIFNPVNHRTTQKTMRNRSVLKWPALLNVALR